MVLTVRCRNVVIFLTQTSIIDTPVHLVSQICILMRMSDGFERGGSARRRLSQVVGGVGDGAVLRVRVVNGGDRSYAGLGLTRLA